MSSDAGGAAISLLKRAVELDAGKRYTEALVCYKEGLQLFMPVVKATRGDPDRTKAFRAKAAEYMDRAEQIARIVEEQKRSGRFHEQTRIAADSTGHSYARYKHFNSRKHHDNVSMSASSDASSTTPSASSTSRTPTSGATTR